MMRINFEEKLVSTLGKVLARINLEPTLKQ